MGNIIGTADVIITKMWKYSSSLSKSANSKPKGRSALIFRESTDYYINS